MATVAAVAARGSSGDDGGGDGNIVVAAKGGSGGGGDRDGGWTRSSTLLKQSLKREFPPLFLKWQLGFVGGGGVLSPLIEPTMGREGK